MKGKLIIACIICLLCGCTQKEMTMNGAIVKDRIEETNKLKKDDKRINSLVHSSNKNLWDKAAEEGLALNGYRKSTFRYTYERGTKDFAYYLIDHGVDTSYEDGQGKNELMYLAEKSPCTSDYKKLVNKLIENGCSINKIDKENHSILENVIINFTQIPNTNSEERERLRFLLEKGAPVREETFSLITESDCISYGALSLLRAPVAELGVKSYNCIGAAYLGDTEYIKTHITELDEEDGKRALFYAAAFGGKDMLMPLLSRMGENYHLLDSDGNSLLMAAAYTGNEENFLYLYDKVDHQIVSKRNETLFTAVLCGRNPKLIQLLLEEPEVFLHNSEADGGTLILSQQNTAVSYMDDISIMEWYEKYCYMKDDDWTWLCEELLRNGQLDFLEIALQSDKCKEDKTFWETVLTSCGTSEETELILKYMPKEETRGLTNALGWILGDASSCIIEDPAGIVRSFYEAGIPLDSSDGVWVPVLEAASVGNTEAVRELIRLGADLDAQQKKDGRTAVMVAAMGDTAILRELLEAGADPNITENSGYTALMIAVIQEQSDCVELLLEYGADKNIKQEEGKTVFDLAKRVKNDRITECLN